MIICDRAIEGKPISIEIEVGFDLGDIVYHRASEDGMRGIVTGYVIWPDGVYYRVTWGNRSESSHYYCELTSERTM